MRGGWTGERMVSLKRELRHADDADGGDDQVPTNRADCASVMRENHSLEGVAEWGEGVPSNRLQGARLGADECRIRDKRLQPVWPFSGSMITGRSSIANPGGAITHNILS